VIGFPRRLFWKVYGALLSSLVAVTILMGVLFWLLGESPRTQVAAPRLSLSDLAIPQRDDPPGAIVAAVDRLSARTGADISVYSASGSLISALGWPVALQASERSPMSPLVVRFDLDDGRVVLARLRPPGPRPGLRTLFMVVVVALGAGLAAFPIAARLTRRLETLRSGVEQWGAGALALRVDETGDDEVAVVARAFNAAAARIEELLTSQKALLANASHELRSPLARLRLAIELWRDRQTPEIEAEIVRNLAELDQLVGEILLASRLDHAGSDIDRPALVDLLGLAAEEAAPFEAIIVGAPFHDAPVEIKGDAKLLRRLIRNLLQNAAKHGRPPIQIVVSQLKDSVRIIVSDQGEGIAPEERERVFEPFYRPPGRSESSGGWGLGLSLVRQIAKRHGGGAHCDADPFGGSRFVVELANGKEELGQSLT
jgi:signal transduction histidine kinase